MKNSLPVKFAERKFLKIKTNQRNKNIYDIQQIDFHENLQQRKRRTPFKKAPNVDVIDQKFQESFLNSTTVNSFKLEYDIEKHREKTGNSYFSSKNHTKCIYFLGDETIQLSPKKQNQIKGVPLNKMITRQYRQSLDNRPNFNEERYNNFYLKSPENEKIRGFQKYIPRQSFARLNTAPTSDSNPEIPHIYEKVVYPSTSFAVCWDYKKQKWDRGPIYSKPNKDSSLFMNEITPEKIDKGLETTSTNWNKTLTNFRSLSSKQTAGQFERNFYPTNMYFRQRKKYKKSERKSIKIKQRAKKPDFERWQICNWKYFQLNPQLRERKIRAYTQ